MNAIITKSFVSNAASQSVVRCLVFSVIQRGLFFFPHVVNQVKVNNQSCIQQISKLNETASTCLSEGEREILFQTVNTLTKDQTSFQQYLNSLDKSIRVNFGLDAIIVLANIWDIMLTHDALCQAALSSQNAENFLNNNQLKLDRLIDKVAQWSDLPPVERANLRFTIMAEKFRLQEEIFQIIIAEKNLQSRKRNKQWLLGLSVYAFVTSGCATFGAWDYLSSATATVAACSGFVYTGCFIVHLSQLLNIKTQLENMTNNTLWLQNYQNQLGSFPEQDQVG